MKKLGWDDVCRMGEKLPGVAQDVYFGRPALKVKGKFMVLLRDDGENLVLHIDQDARELLMAMDPGTFHITDHYRKHPALLIRLATVKRAQLRDLLEQTWRSQAPKSLRQSSGK
jgi:hypothetical protein